MFRNFKTDRPEPGTSVLAFSPVYKRGDPMRLRAWSRCFPSAWKKSLPTPRSKTSKTNASLTQCFSEGNQQNGSTYEGRS